MKNLIHWFLDWKQWFMDAMFPPRCIICQQEGFFLCEEHELPAGGRPHWKPQNLENIFFATSYADPTVKRLVNHFKFRGNTELAQYFTNTIAKNTPSEVLENALIIPVPLHWTRKLWRGFNQAEVIAQHLQERYPEIEISTDLKRIRRTKQQARLSREKRFENLEKAFLWSGIPLNSEKTIVLLDDVVTTGGTIEEAAKELKRAGAKNIIALTFAGGGK